MANYDIRGWETNTGLRLIYYEVPFTYSEASAMFKTAIYRNEGELGIINDRYYDEPVLSIMRSIARRVVRGENNATVLLNNPGTHFLLKKNGQVEEEVNIASSPGAWSYENYSINLIEGSTVDALSFYGNFGSITTNLFNSLALFRTQDIFGQYIPTRLQPYPPIGGMYKYTPLAAPAYVGPTGTVKTSDNIFFRFYLRYETDVFKWLSVSIETSMTGRIFGKGNPEDYKDVLIETVDVDEENSGGNNGDGGDDVMRRYSPRAQTSGIGVYQLNRTGTQDLLQGIWNSNIFDSIKAKFIGDGSNAILGLKWFYGVRQYLQTAELSSYITVGNVKFTDYGKKPVITHEFVKHDFGHITVPRKFGDYRDYTEVVYRMYLPFVGIIELDPADVVGKTLYLTYRINVTDGTAVVVLSNIDNSDSTTGIIFTTSCTYGYDIPVSASNVKDPLTSIISAVGAGQFLEQNRSYSAGQLASDSTVMGDFQAKLIYYPKDDLSGNIETSDGLPSAKTVRVGDASGYLKATVVYGGGLATRRSADIIDLLQNGVYI